jgi:endonuclease III
MTNKEIIEKIYKLNMLLRTRNGQMAAVLERSTIPLIEHDRPLATATRKDLMGIAGIGEIMADLILRVIKGEHVYDIAKTVPKYKRREKWELECMKEGKSGASSRI